MLASDTISNRCSHTHGAEQLRNEEFVPRLEGIEQSAVHPMPSYLADAYKAQWGNDDALGVVGLEIDDKTRRDDQKSEKMLFRRKCPF
jgi:hypothetical protein